MPIFGKNFRRKYLKNHNIGPRSKHGLNKYYPFVLRLRQRFLGSLSKKKTFLFMIPDWSPTGTDKIAFFVLNFPRQVFWLGCEIESGLVVVVFKK
jgi:hypothetical protein